MSEAILFYRKITVKGLITTVALLSVLDLALTHSGLQSGYLVELNPLIRYAFEKAGLLKLFLPLYFLILFAVLYRYAGVISWLRTVMIAVFVIKVVVILQHLAILITVFVVS